MFGLVAANEQQLMSRLTSEMRGFIKSLGLNPSGVAKQLVVFFTGDASAMDEKSPIIQILNKFLQIVYYDNFVIDE